MANVNMVVRPGRTVSVGEAQADDEGKALPPRITNYGPGEAFSIEKAEAERLAKNGAAVYAGSEEAAAAKRIADTIPDNFPGAKELREAGITTFSALREVEDLDEIDGIGQKTEEKILAALEKQD